MKKTWSGVAAAHDRQTAAHPWNRTASRRGVIQWTYVQIATRRLLWNVSMRHYRAKILHVKLTKCFNTLSLYLHENIITKIHFICINDINKVVNGAATAQWGSPRSSRKSLHHNVQWSFCCCPLVSIVFKKKKWNIVTLKNVRSENLEYNRLSYIDNRLCF